MAKQKKQPRPKAETPKGFRDYFGSEVTQRAEMLRAIEGVDDAVVQAVPVSGARGTMLRAAVAMREPRPARELREALGAWLDPVKALRFE